MMPDMNDPEDNVPGNLQKLNDIYQTGLEFNELHVLVAKNNIYITYSFQLILESFQS